MIPVISDDFTKDFEESEIPSKDYCLDIESNKITGTIEQLEQLKQSIYFMLNTERYDFLIYSWDYGVELKDLFGQPYSYVVPEIERRVAECLTQDDRIESVGDFSFEKVRNQIHATFLVSTIYGTIESGVNVNV